MTVTLNTAPTPGTLGVVVTTNDISSGNEVQVANIVEVPIITSISPAAGPKGGGNVITINGLSLSNVTAVTIGGNAASSFTVVNGQKITAITPPGTFGAANVFVTDINGTNSATANTLFNYTFGAFDALLEPFSPSFPHALSINAPGSVVGNSASFTVTFNQTVTGVDAADFTLITTGTVAGGTISSITGSGTNYTVNVTGITGAGTLGLNLVNSPTITALPSFAAQAIVATASKTASVILGDVNGDGELDIITANYNSANVRVLLGNGNGTFKDQQTIATGTQPFSVTLGDVNGDGSLDIITANRGSNNASVLLGNGDGAIKAQTILSTGTSPRSVALGDVNGDGTLDIVTANQDSSNVSVLLGTGNGSFANQAQFLALNDRQAYSVALGDVNGDGKLDIVVGNISGSNASLLLGNGDGTFQGSQNINAGGAQCFVALGDVNGDGKLDIVIARAGNDVALVIGNGNGTFQNPQTVGSGTKPRSLSLADVNGDGRLDILTANFGSTANNASVLLGNGNGIFQGAANFATGTNSRSATLGDVNGDGRLDIIAANFNSDDASVILGTGGSAIFACFSPQQTFATGNGAQSHALGDLNGDGKLDMVTGNLVDDTASVLLGNGNGTFKDQTTVATGDAPRSVTLGDVNSDGRLDIVTANRNSNNASVLLGNGNGTFKTQTTFTTGGSPRSVALGDVNGDGRLDIITANNNSDNASVLLGNGNGTFQTQATFATGSNPRAVALGDVNDDGKLDLITANNGAASASVLLGNGNGTFQTQATFTTGSNPSSVTVGDVNGDSRLDIITANFADNSVSVLLGNGNGTFQTQATFATNRPYSVSLGDLNGDGRLDIITASYSSDTARVLLGNGNGTFAAEVIFAAGDVPLSVALGDLNGDGRLDITTTNSNSRDASVLLNSLAFTGQIATLDAIAPTAPTITSITDDAAPITGIIAPGGVTNDTSLDLTGTAEAASTVSIYNGSTLLGSTTADNTTGAWSYSPTGLVNGSTYVFNATATDAAGNISTAFSSNYSVTVDADTAPAGSITQTTDSDGDGLREVVIAPDGTSVDGNRDGIPDATQRNVTGLRLINNGASGSDYGAISISNGIQLARVSLTSANSNGIYPVTTRSGVAVVTTTPIGIANALSGVVSFNVSGVTPGGRTEVTIHFPSGLAAGSGNAYLRFNYSTNRFEEYVDADGKPLYTFVDSNGDGNVDGVKLTLVDGDPSWDGDGLANGTIVDPGFYGKGDRTFIGTKGRDILIGNVLANTIASKKGKDTINGDLGNDILVGGKGRDRLTGGEGSDQLSGGRGRDRFIYTSITDSRGSTATRDTITDFRGRDKIDLSAIDANSTIDGNQAFTFIKKKSFSGVSGQLRFSGGFLEADINGDKQADFAIALTGVNRVYASSFVL